MCTKNHDHMLYCSWDLACARCNSYFSFWAIFCPFTPVTAKKTKISKKMKKTPGDIIILHKCTTDDNHMIYGSWDMKCVRQNFLPFWTAFCPFTLPPNNPKNQNFEKLKKTPGDIIILHKCTKNHDHMLYCSWDMAHDGCNSYFSSWAIFGYRWTDRRTDGQKKW